MTNSGRTSDPVSIIRCLNCGKPNRIKSAAHGTPRCGSCRQAMPWLVDATAATFDQEVTSSVPVVVDLWAPWCGPCRMMAPALEQLARQRAGRLKVVNVNVDEHPTVAARFTVQGIPLLVLMRDGREIARQAGAAPLPQLERWIDAALTSAA